MVKYLGILSISSRLKPVGAEIIVQMSKLQKLAKVAELVFFASESVFYSNHHCLLPFVF